ncbi:MAG: hypothetical protein IPK99_13125 [Flavobacteriales bacterium]|nr:hypothetical protein [Flavobacteriales bacterium]
MEGDAVNPPSSAVFSALMRQYRSALLLQWPQVHRGSIGIGQFEQVSAGRDAIECDFAGLSFSILF